MRWYNDAALLKHLEYYAYYIEHRRFSSLTLSENLKHFASAYDELLSRGIVVDVDKYKQYRVAAEIENG